MGGNIVFAVIVRKYFFTSGEFTTTKPRFYVKKRGFELEQFRLYRSMVIFIDRREEPVVIE